MVQLDNDSEKLNSKFRKIRGRRSLMYFISFAFCDVASGGISGSADVRNKLCILSNNLFNQYYFLILWVRWVFLLLVSLLGLLNRMLQLCVPGITAAIFRYSLVPHNLEDRAND